MEYHVLWDIEHACDGLSETFPTIEAAKPHVVQIYEGWIEGAYDLPADEWNDMIETCSAWIAVYDPKTDEYEDVWWMSYEELEAIGWTERSDE